MDVLHEEVQPGRAGGLPDRQDAPGGVAVEDDVSCDQALDSNSDPDWFLSDRWWLQHRADTSPRSRAVSVLLPSDSDGGSKSTTVLVAFGGVDVGHAVQVDGAPSAEPQAGERMHLPGQLLLHHRHVVVVDVAVPAGPDEIAH